MPFSQQDKTFEQPADLEQETGYLESYEMPEKEIEFHLVKKGTDYVIHFINTDIEVDIPDTQEKAEALFDLAVREAKFASNEDDLVTVLNEQMTRDVKDENLEAGTIV